MKTSVSNQVAPSTRAASINSFGTLRMNVIDTQIANGKLKPVYAIKSAA